MRTLSLLAALALVVPTLAGTYHAPLAARAATINLPLVPRSSQPSDAPLAETPPEPSTINNHYIIQYDDDLAHKDAHSALGRHSVRYSTRHEYDIFNGLALHVQSDHDGHALASIPGIKSVWPVTTYRLPNDANSSRAYHTQEHVQQLLRKRGILDPNQQRSYHTATGVDILQNQHNLTGKGIKVGIIDTGIDFKHPAFAWPGSGATAGCLGGINCRVQAGFDFVGDYFNGSSTRNIFPDFDPTDCQGHGTHLAGIIGGNAMNMAGGPKPPQPFIGVAPEVTFGAYKIFGCSGETISDLILAALELAAKDKMDIVNMSLGGGSSYASNPIAVMSDKLAQKGIIVVAAAGNDGADGVWMVADAGLGHDSTSAASFNAPYLYTNAVSYGLNNNDYTDANTFAYSFSTTYNKIINLPSTPLAPLIQAGSLRDGCTAASYQGIDVRGKIVLAAGDYSQCRSTVRGQVAKSLGALGMLLPSGNTQQLDAIEGIPGFPMASLPFEAGASILATFSQNPATTVVWSPSLMPFALGESGIPSSFSSLGLDGDLGSKPDLAAPGGSILSTYPLARGGYKVVSGTSMATPYIAGSYALYLQAKGRKPTPSVIRTVFKNTAQIWKNATTGVYGSAAKQGAGLINTLNAVMTSSSITPDHIDLLDTVHFRGSIELTINNMGKQAETYTLSHFPAEALNSYPTIKKFPLATPLSEKADAVAQFNPASVVVAAGQSAKVTVTFQEPAQGNPANFILYSGYVVATPATQGSSPAHVPYTGIKGDISQVPIMDTDNGFPALARLQGNGKGLLIPPTTVYNFDLRRELPIVLTRPGSHTPDAQIRVHDMATKQFVGYLVDKDSTGAFGEQGRIQNLDAGGNLATHPWIWRGYVVTEKSETATPTRLGPGMYTIVVASQRKLTKGQYPQDYEVFEVGSIGLSS